MPAPPTKASQTADALPTSFRRKPESRGERAKPRLFRGEPESRGSSAGESVRSRSERMVLYPAHVFPSRRTEEATAPARGTNRAMTGAHLHKASRRADGLATSAVLEQNTYRPRQSMRVVARAKPETRRCFEPIRFPPLAGEMSERTKGAHTPRLNAPKNHPSPFCVSKRGTRQAKRDAGGSYITAHHPNHKNHSSKHTARGPNYIGNKPSCGFVHGARAVHAFGRGNLPS